MKIIKDGTSQNDRFQEPLKKDYFNVHEMSFEDLLAMSVDYGRLLYFYNLQYDREGDWECFFTSDETVVMALILSTNIKQIESEFLKDINLSFEDSDSNNLKAVQHIFRLMDIINFVYEKLNAIDTRGGASLRDNIRVLKEDRLAKEEEFIENYRQWWSSHSEVDENNYYTIGHIRSYFYSFLNAISYLKEITVVYLEESFKNQSHNPITGLYIAFLKLFQKAQYELNLFTQRHLKFYYFDVLRMKYKELLPDSTYLSFETDSTKKEILIKKGTEFIGKTDDSNKELIYTADNDLIVNGAEVKSIYTLFFERNQQNSPEGELGLITAGKVNEIAVSEKTNSVGDKVKTAWPIFGAAKSKAEEVNFQDAEIGFALASPVLFLKEGQSYIKVSFKYEHSSQGDKTEFNNILNSISKLTASFEITEETLNALQSEGVPDSVLKKLENLKDQIITGEKNFILLLNKTIEVEQTTIYKSVILKYSVLIKPNKQDAFLKAFYSIFKIYLTTEKDWLEISEYIPEGHFSDSRIEENSLNIYFQLHPADDPIVAYNPEIHGGQHETDLPIIKFVINSDSYVYSYSFLSKLTIKDIEITVDVKDVKNVLVYSNSGQLDINSPFYPFGSLPTTNSYFIIGNYEMAKKNITTFDINIEWGDLPLLKGGFNKYYLSYEKLFDNTIFQVRIEMLRDSKWVSKVGSDQKKFRLFAPLTLDEKVSKDIQLKVTGLEQLEPVRIVSEDGFRYDAAAKGGFFKLTLTNPDYAFGHNDYAYILTNVLSYNTKHKEKKPVPNNPYTPLINTLSIDYKATTTIHLKENISLSDNSFHEKVFHIHPFGIEKIYPGRSYRNCFLLPQYLYEGNLFIGLSMEELFETITLFFRMREDSTLGTDTEPPEIHWYYLSSNRWEKFKKSHIISNTTNGFLSSGVVTLDIPDKINCENTIMPNHLFWISAKISAAFKITRLSLEHLTFEEIPEHVLKLLKNIQNQEITGHNKFINLLKTTIGEEYTDKYKHSILKYARDTGVIRSLCSAYLIKTQGLRVTSQNRDNILSQLKTKLPANSIKESRITIPGISKIYQMVDSFKGCPRESDEQLITRTSERLRHKKRATTSWDYERLILEGFPEIYKVKCFSHMSTERFITTGKQHPGHILIVVIPTLKDQAVEADLKPRINSLLLKEIKAYLIQYTSSFVEIEVCNPEYEQIQIRCTVKFSHSAWEGKYIKKLSQAISDYLSPWEQTGYRARFGWCIRRSDIESFINHLDYIDFITNFSMLHITKEENKNYRLDDTVSVSDIGTQYIDEINPTYPWSIAIPIKQHFIEIIDEEKTILAERTGVNELEVGNTFIITG